MKTNTALALLALAVSTAACALPANAEEQPENDRTETSALTAETPAVSTTVHDNYLSVNFSSSLQSRIGFTKDDGVKVSDGQPFEGITVTEATVPVALSIDVKAGRHKTSAVADWFNDRATRAGAAGAFDSKPGELNFAFSGHFDLDAADGTSGRYLVVVGQGSDPGTGRNNWWFGGQGEGWKKGWAMGGLQPCVITPDGKFTFTTQEVDVLNVTEGSLTCFAAD